jgi:hypothetical protein
MQPILNREINEIEPRDFSVTGAYQTLHLPLTMLSKEFQHLRYVRECMMRFRNKVSAQTTQRKYMGIGIVKIYFLDQIFERWGSSHGSQFPLLVGYFEHPRTSLLSCVCVCGQQWRRISSPHHRHRMRREIIPPAFQFSSFRGLYIAESEGLILVRTRSFTVSIEQCTQGSSQ